MALTALPGSDCNADALDVLVADFLAGLTGVTAEAYRRDLSHASRWLAGTETDFLAARRAELARYVRAQEDAGVAAATIARRLAALSGLYQYLCGEGVLEHSPVAGLRRPKGGGASRLGLDAMELHRVLEAARATRGCAELLVSLLLFCGLRVSEARSLDADSLRAHEGRVVVEVCRKGGHHELVGVPNGLRALIEKTVAAQGAGPILRSQRGARLSREGAHWIVRRLGEKALLPGPLYPHLLRHSYVSQALFAGVALPVVAAGAGHRDIRSTIGYARALEAIHAVAGEAVAARVDVEAR